MHEEFVAMREQHKIVPEAELYSFLISHFEKKKDNAKCEFYFEGIAFFPVPPPPPPAKFVCRMESACIFYLHAYMTQVGLEKYHAFYMIIKSHVPLFGAVRNCDLFV